MTSLINKGANTYRNMTRDVQWYFLEEIRLPWQTFKGKYIGRQQNLDKWHVQQKEKFKEVFKAAFLEEQEAILPQRKELKKRELEQQGVSAKEIEKQLKKIKKESFDDEKSKVTNLRYIKHLDKAIEKEQLDLSRDNKKEGMFQKYRFTRNGHKLRIFTTEPFFKETDGLKMISWPEFKTQVFYDYIARRQEFLKTIEREKRIYKTTQEAWKQLWAERKSEADGITYDQMQKRLRTFHHVLSEDFFKQPFWLENGDQNIESLEFLLTENFKINHSQGDIYQFIRDIEAEVNITLTEDDVTLGKQSIHYDIEKSRNSKTNNTKNSKKSKESSKGSSSSQSDEDSKTGAEQKSKSSNKNSKNSNKSNHSKTSQSGDSKEDSKSNSKSDSKSIDSKTNDTQTKPQTPKHKKSKSVVSRFFNSLKRIGSKQKLDVVDIETEDDNGDVQEDIVVVAGSNASGSTAGSTEDADECVLEEYKDKDATEDSAGESQDTLKTQEPEDNKAVAGDSAPESSVNTTESSVNTSETSQVGIVNPTVGLLGTLETQLNQIDSPDIALTADQLVTQESKDVFKQIPQPVTDSSKELYSLLLTQMDSLQATQLKLDQEIQEAQKVAKSKTSGLSKLMSKSKTIQDRKKVYKLEIDTKINHRNEFQSDHEKIVCYLKTLYRQALQKMRPCHDTCEIAQDHGSWCDKIKSHCGVNSKDQDPPSRSKSKRSLSVSHLLQEAKTYCLPVTLESCEAVESKCDLLKGNLQCTADITLPSCVNYSNELPPCQSQEMNYPGCIESLCIVKEWQEYKNYGLREKLSREYLCDKLNACHQKAITAVNECVSVSVWDVLNLVKCSGIPTCTMYTEFKLKSKEKTGDWIRQHMSRFKSLCMKHSVDQLHPLKSTLEIKVALHLYGPVLCHLPDYNSGSTQFYKKDSDDQKKLGYHTVVLAGYNDDSKTFLARNTVGDTFGDFGYSHIPYDVMNDPEMHTILAKDITLPKKTNLGVLNNSSINVPVNIDVPISNPVTNLTVPLAGGSENGSGSSSQGSQGNSTIVEDSRMKEAKKKCLSHSPSIYNQFAFETIGFAFLPVIKYKGEEYFLSDPRILGTCCIGFASDCAIEKWSNLTKGYWVFVDQDVNYIHPKHNKIIKVNYSSIEKKWQVTRNCEQFKVHGLITVYDISTGEVIDNSDKIVICIKSKARYAQIIHF